MGLSGPRKRTKISHDPNNTTWSRSTANFGHRILTAQGWSPGDFLGAQNAYHADLRTAANASHIRVALKDDTLGLGAKKGSGLAEGECTGLDAFQGLLGRLNGKAENVIQQEQKTRKDLKRDLYVDRRWGAMNFLPGGLLVGDQIKELVTSESQQEIEEPESDTREASRTRKEQKKKQKEKADQKPKKKRRKPTSQQDNDNPDASTFTSTSTTTPSTPNLEDSNPEQEPASDLDVRTAEKAEKAAKKQRKLDRRAKKEERKLKAGLDNTAPLENDDISPQEAAEEEENENEEKKKKKKAKTAATPLPPPPPPGGGGQRHAVRQRFIRQKRLATMDPQSLKEIFMMKA